MLTLLLHTALGGAATLKTCEDPSEALPKGLESVKKRVVRIQTVTGSGSGAIISPDGFVLTAAHVVGSASKVEVVLADESVHPGEVIATEADADVALVRIDTTGLPCLSMSEQPAPTGSDLFLVGSPSGKQLTHSVTKGIVSGYRDNEGIDVLQTDASLSPGYSGGPVLGLDGRVQGVISFKVVGEAVEGIGFATTAAQSERSLGISFGAMTEIDRAALPDHDEPTPKTYEGTVEVTDRPQHVGPPLDRFPCHRLDFAAEKDPFTDKRRVRGQGRDLFAYEMGEGIEPKLILFAPVRVFYDVDGEHQPRVDIKLLDGTKITMTATRPPEMRLSTILTPTVAVAFPLDRRVVEAFASSGPTIQRWTYGENTVDLERSERQRVKYFRPHFSCLLRHWDP